MLAAVRRRFGEARASRQLRARWDEFAALAKTEPG
jgi:hypothetical protein